MASTAQLPPDRRHRVQRALFVSPEIPPFVKSGGLGDVTAALPAALRGLGIDARVLVPGYRAVLDAFPEATPVAEFPAYAALPACRLLAGMDVNGAPLLVVDCPEFFRREGSAYQDPSFVDFADNHLRFGLLSRVAARLGALESGFDWHPDVIHCNDWPTGLAAAYLQLMRRPRAACVMAIHNMSHQGVFPAQACEALGIPWPMFNMYGVEYYGKLSFLKAGLYYAERLVTVSPTYAHEIQTEAGGHGLGGLLHARQVELIGILNGIDTTVWNPAKDARIPQPYTFRSIARKAADKLALQQRLGLEPSQDRMLLGVVSRLAYQKGIDWTLQIAPALAESGIQLAVLGTGEPKLERELAAAARAHRGRIAAVIGYDDVLSHLVEAGADAFLMPSRFEPCGLNQMYSLRYGTPPIVRATGGLADTVVDCTEATLADGTANGFSFSESTPEALWATIRRAHDAWRAPEIWRALQRRGMSQDFSWTVSARRYRSLYEDAVANRMPA